MEGWYNRKRIHGSIGYFTSDAHEKMCQAAAKKGYKEISPHIFRVQLQSFLIVR
ncbi:hypothetical protein ACIQXF_07575 [Lysinibacillus sp. NPDC097231]|uniref:hypothetical protein n=1 Tax=Lysinibacillus sp. NPDC097231 TaxID=3364142 RepID=UPI0038294D60